VATRVYHSSDNSGGNTNTQSATVFTVHRTLTFTPAANSSYLLLGYCETQVDNSATRDSQVILYDETTPTQLRATQVEMNQNDGAEWWPCSLASVVTFGESPSEMTYTIKHKLESTVTDADSVCRNGTLVALKLDAADASMVNSGSATSTANPGLWTDYNAASGDDALIFTPGSTGDYLVLAWARCSYSATTNGAQIELLCEDGTTEVALQRWVPTDSTTLATYAAAVKRPSLTAAEQTFKLRHARAVSGSGTSTLAEVTMVALRLDAMNGNTATEDTGADTTTSATYVDLGDTRADTLASGIDYLLIATADYESDTGGVDTSLLLTDSTNTYAEPVFDSGVAARGRTFLVPRVITGAGASVTHKFQGKSNGTATLSLDEHRLYVLQVEASASGTEADAEVASGTGTSNAATTTVAPAGGNAASTGTAQTPQAAVAVPAESTAGTGTAYDATVSRTGEPLAEVAAATGTAQTPTVTVATPAEATEATATAHDGTVTRTGEPDAETASSTGTAQTPQVSVATPAGSAAATGSAHDATVSTGSATNADAEAASSSATAQTPQASVAPSAGNAAATGTASDATVTGTAAPAAAEATGTASGAQVSIAPAAGNATATGSAHDATVSTDADTNAAAEAATATGSASDATVRISVSAILATVAAVAYDPGGSIAPAATEATAAATGYAPQPSVAPSAGDATATGTAQVPTLTTTVTASVATVTGTASDASAVGAPPDPNPIDVTYRERATATHVEAHHRTYREHAVASFTEDHHPTIRDRSAVIAGL
jgi:hypothetical protein